MKRYTKISLYIPPKRSVYEVIAQLKQEKNQAERIQDQITKQKMIRALSNMIGFFKGFKTIEDNGLVIFAEDSTMTVKTPKKPLDFSLYRCSDHFDRKKEFLKE